MKKQYLNVSKNFWRLLCGFETASYFYQKLIEYNEFDFTLSSNERLKVAVLEYKKRTGFPSIEHRNN